MSLTTPATRNRRKTLPTPVYVALVGNPNAGKSTLFNALTGHRQRVANYPGTTIEKRAGSLRRPLGRRPIEIVDLPGAYSLAACSQDEAIVLDVLLGRQTDVPTPSVIVSVVDGTNLARHLFLTTQIIELGRPVVVALTMSDLLLASGRQVDTEALSNRLGVPVVPVVATSGKGIDALRRAIEEAMVRPVIPPGLEFPDTVRWEIEHLAKLVDARGECSTPDSCPAELLQAILNPDGHQEQELSRRVGPSIRDELIASRKRLGAAGISIAEVEAEVRYGWIGQTVQVVQFQPRRNISSWTERVDRVLTHRGLGLLVLVLLMAACFQAIYTWSAPLMDFIDAGFRFVGRGLAALIPPGALQSLLVNGVVAGVGAVLTFLPQIVILFLFIAIVEDCGYLARAAFLLDRWMHLLGLPGKAFIPLLSSFACAVPGIMATRVMEERRDRLLTMLIAPLMSCSARLPVYTLMIAAFIPAKPLLGGFLSLQAVTLLGMYFAGSLVAVPVAWVLKRTLLKGPPQPFLMEMPTYRWPSPRTVFFRVYDQGKAFCVSAGTMIFAVTVVIWALGYYPHPASIASEFDKQRQAVIQDAPAPAEAVAVSDAAPDDDDPLALRLAEIDRAEAGTYLRQSILGRLGAWIEPAVKPLGWDWRIGTAAIASFPAREVVIATLGTIYNLGADVDEGTEGLRSMLRQAAWPDGRPVYNMAVALSIMVFFALCCQCGATLAAIKREANSWRWPLFTFAYMTALAYLGALVTYQAAARFA